MCALRPSYLPFKAVATLHGLRFDVIAVTVRMGCGWLATSRDEMGASLNRPA